MWPMYNKKCMESPVWDEIVYMHREKLDALHFQRVRKMLKYCYDRVPFYRRLYDAAGIKPEDVKTWEDFYCKVPRFDKPDLLNEQDQNPDGIALKAMDLSYGLYYYETSGTTGRPFRELSTFFDIYNTADVWAMGWWNAGVRPGDSVYFCFDFAMFAGFWTAFRGCERLGLRILSGARLNSEQRVNQILSYRPTVVMGTPTYLIHLIETAKKMGLDLRDAGVKYTTGAGEPGGNVPTTRKKIIQGFGCKKYIDIYGISDLMFGSVECHVECGGVHINETAFYSYFIDQEGKVIKEDGQVGEHIVTGFNRFLQPVINYRTHDLVRPYWHHDHGCNWTFIFLDGAVLGRTDYMVTIKGTNVYPTAVENLLADVEDLSNNYEVHVSLENDMDKMEVVVEAGDGVPEEQYGELSRRLEEVYRTNIRVGIGVKVVSPMTLPRYELKSKRFFDHRKR